MLQRMLLLLIPGMVALACSISRGVSQPTSFDSLFDGYTLINVSDAEGDVAAVLNAPAPVLAKASQLQPEWRVGRQYIFTKAHEQPNEKVALEVFPSRLSSIGARVIKRPRTRDDLVYLVLGGPLFVIEFEHDGRHGVIFNRIGRVDDKPVELLFFAFL